MPNALNRQIQEWHDGEGGYVPVFWRPNDLPTKASIDNADLVAVYDPVTDTLKHVTRAALVAGLSTVGSTDANTYKGNGDPSASDFAAIAGIGPTLLTTQLAAKAPLASPTFTGTPTAPTAGAGTNTTQIATTAFVHTEIVNLGLGALATLNSISLTGDVTGSGSSSIATTIANGAVTYAKMQNVSATNRVLGRISAGAGNPEELTGANVRTITGLATTDSPTFAGLTLSGLSGVLKASGGVVSGGATTTDLPEGSNLYYTDARARAALSGTTNQVNYNNLTGVFSLPQNIHTGASPQFTGLTLSGLTQGSILFAGVSGLLSQDNSNLFWDATNKHLGLACNTFDSWGSGYHVIGLNSAKGFTIAAGTTTGAGMFLTDRAYFDGSNWKYSTTGNPISNLYLSTGVIGLRVAANGTAGNTVTWLNALTINNDGSSTFGGNVLLNAASANLYLKDTSTGWQASTTKVINPQSGNSLRNLTYTSGLTGWSINDNGIIEANQIDVRGSIRTTLLVFNAAMVTAGTQLITKSGAKLLTDLTIPTTPTYGTTTVNVDVVDQDGVSHAASQLFVVNDVLRVRGKGLTGGADLGTVGETWLKVSSVSDQTTFWRYVCTIQAGTANFTYAKNLPVADYGQSGGGLIMLTADQTNAPYLQMATHAASFSSADSSGTLNVTPQLRLGNLNGSYNYSSDVYGLAAGQYGSTDKTWFTIEQTNGLRFGNNATTLAQWDTSGVITIGQVASGQSNIRISSGALDLRVNTTILTHLATDGSAYFGNGNLAISSGGVLTVGNWTVNSSSISSGGITLAASATAASNKIYVGTGTYNNSNTAFYVDGSGQFSLKDKLTWDGTTLTITGGGTFSGALSAATGTFAGSLSAATGTFAGSLSAATGTFAGSLTAGSGTISGDLNIGSGGDISSGATAILTGNGYWLDYNAGTPRFRIGTVASSALTKGLYWDGSDLTVKSGSLLISNNGIAITATSSYSLGRAVYTVDGSGNTVGSFSTQLLAASSYVTVFEAREVTGVNNSLYFYCTSPTGKTSQIQIATYAHLTQNGLIQLDSALKINSSNFNIDSSGNVGIGVTSPSSLLHVKGSIPTFTFEYSGTIAKGRLTSATSGGWLATTLNATFDGTNWNLDDTSLTGLICKIDVRSGVDVFQVAHLSSGTNPRTFTALFTVNGSGTLQLDTYGAGTLQTDASGNVTASSDERIKTAIRPFQVGLEAARRVKPIIYRYAEHSNLDKDNDYTGLSAQNVAHIQGATWKHPKTGLFSLSHNALIANLYNSVNELDQKDKDLEAEILALQARIVTLEGQVRQLGGTV